MTGEHTGPGHGRATVSTCQTTTDGGKLVQSWTVCECELAAFRPVFGPPDTQAYSTPEHVAAATQVLLSLPGSIITRADRDG